MTKQKLRTRSFLNGKLDVKKVLGKPSNVEEAETLVTGCFHIDPIFGAKTTLLPKAGKGICQIKKIHTGQTRRKKTYFQIFEARTIGKQELHRRRRGLYGVTSKLANSSG